MPELGRPWRQGALALVPQPHHEGGPIRIGYARCSAAQQELQSQLDAIGCACRKTVFSEKISTRVKVRPKLEKALKLDGHHRGSTEGEQ